MAYYLRKARPRDVPDLQRLIDASVRTLGADFYEPAQIESSLRHLFGVDSTMLQDGTYFVVDAPDGGLAGAGGWSFRKTAFGGDSATPFRDGARRLPGVEAAVIRAFYVHPDHARRGIGGLLLRAGEDAARAAGFDRFELVATMSGVPFYRAMGYHALRPVPVALPDGTVIDCQLMEKRA